MLEGREQNIKSLPEPKSHRLEILDSIRGLAASAVLLFHTSGAFLWPPSWTKWTRLPFINMAFDGRDAVTMFFVLSGFVLARPYVSEISKPLNVPIFYLRRITRIWLPWFSVFLISLFFRCFIFRTVSTQPPANYWTWQHPVQLKDLLLQCAFCFHNLKEQCVPQDWSLGIELVGSALIPILVFLTRKRLHLIWMALLGVALATTQQNFYNCGTYYISFILGVLLARHSPALIVKIKQFKLFPQFLILLVGAMLYQTRRLEDHFSYNDLTADKVAWISSSFGCAIIITACLSSRRISAALTRKPVLWIGKVSFSVYLLQNIVILCFLPPIFAVLNRVGFGASFLRCLALMPVPLGVAFTFV